MFNWEHIRRRHLPRAFKVPKLGMPEVDAGRGSKFRLVGKPEDSVREFECDVFVLRRF